MNVIETRQLTKEYRRYKKREGIRGSIQGLFHREYETKKAVNNIDFTVSEGEFVGLIGPNGAGKTTLMKLLTGIIAPTEGEISVLGFYPNKLQNELKKQYAIVMGQKSQLFFDLTTADMLKLYKEIYGISQIKYEESKDYFTNLFGVKELLDVQVRTLSLGERMKMELMVALLHNPKILFLDEPTIGLDAIASKQIRQFLKEVNEKRGTTILLTSHYMEDIKLLCNRAVVINHGNKIYDGSTDELFNKFQKSKRLTFSFHNANEVLVPEKCKVIEHTQDKISLEVSKDMASDVLEQIMKSQMPLDVLVEDEEIGTVVERIYQSKAEQLGGVFACESISK